MSVAGVCQEVLVKIQAWLDSVKAGDLEAVMAFYAKEAAFLPTLSSKVASGEAFVRAYHCGDEAHPGFTMRKPEGKLVGDVFQRVSEDGKMVVSSGCYDFVMEGAVTHARFTFVHDLIDGVWLITTHHSSLVPNIH